MSANFNYGVRKYRLTVKSQLTTTKLNTTTDHTSTFNIDGLTRGVFVTSVYANSTTNPAIYLDASVDGGSTYTQYATLHPDLTTTANARILYVANLPQYCRMRLLHRATSTRTRYYVKAEFMP